MAQIPRIGARNVLLPRYRAVSYGIDVNTVEIPEQECPNCHEPIPVDEGYPTWCDRCDWNVRPPRTAVSDAPFASLYARLGEKSGRRLFEQLMQTETLRSTMTPVKLLGFTAATAVHGATLLSA